MLAILLLFALATTAFAAETPLSTPVATAAFNAQAGPEIASDGTNFLVAWRDNRHADNYMSIWATRVAPDGRMLDLPTGIPIESSTFPPPTSGTNSPPAVVWTGSSWLVLWTGSDFNQIHEARVERDGRIVESGRRSFDGGLFVPEGAAAAGGRVLATWQGWTGSKSFVFGRLLDENGTPAGEPIFLSRDTATGGDMNPLVASNGRSFLAAWWHFDVVPYIALARVSTDGTLGAVRLIPTKSMPVLASSGGDFLLVYIDNSGALEAQHVDEQGRFISQHVLPQQPSSFPFTGITLAASGSGYLMSVPMTGPSVTTVTAEQLDRDGVPLGEVPITPSGTSRGSVALATNGTDVLAAWPEGADSTDVYSRIVGKQPDDTLLSRSASVQRFATPATDGDALFAAWLEWRPEGLQLRAGPVPHDGEGTLVSTNVGQVPPAVTFDGRNYVVAWLKNNPYGEVAYVRVAPDGRLIDATPLTVSHATGSQVALSSNGRESLLAWTGSTVFAVRLDQNALQLDAPQRISFDDFTDSTPQIAWNGSMWLVAWEETIPAPNPCFVCGRPPVPPTHDIHAARVTAAMQLLDPVAIVVAGSSADEAMPSVASNGTDFVVTWSESVVRARHVDANGTQSAVINLSSGSNSSVASRGGDYFVAWADAGHYFWTPLLPTPVRISLASNGDYFPSVSLAATRGGLFAMYHRIDEDRASGSVPRVFVRDLALRSRERPTGR